MMREYPVTVASHMYHINSSASNLFDDDQYQRKLPTIETDINCGRFHQTPATAQSNNNNINNNNNTNKATANYICTSNGDLTSLQSGRLQNFSNINNIHNNNCNRSHKIAVKSGNNKSIESLADGVECNDNNRPSNTNGSYSIFDAITGHCTNSVYPANERNENDFDQINLSHSDPVAASTTSSHGQKNGTSHLNNDCGQFQHYNYHFNTAARTHQFPSANYKHSYLLWIGTPVAARYYPPTYLPTEHRTEKKISIYSLLYLICMLHCVLFISVGFFFRYKYRYKNKPEFFHLIFIEANNCHINQCHIFTVMFFSYQFNRFSWLLYLPIQIRLTVEFTGKKSIVFALSVFVHQMYRT